MLVGACELVEEGGLAAVLVPRQGKGQLGIVRQGILRGFHMVLAALAQARVLDPLPLRLGIRRRRFWRIVPDIFNRDLLGIGHPQGQLIAVDHEFHGIPQGGVFYQQYIRARNDAHVQEVLPQRALAAHSLDGGPFSDWQFS